MQTSDARSGGGGQPRESGAFTCGRADEGPSAVVRDGAGAFARGAAGSIEATSKSWERADSTAG
jgi:hypothetical protein